MPIGLVAAGVGAAGAIGSAVIGSSAASSAANTQANAETQAAQLMHDQYEQTRGDLLPYNTTGQQANAAITAMGPFNFAPTQANLESTPGYQFALSQGLKANQNQAASRGLGVSGAALKGADAFTTGLASQTYQQQFGNALQSYNENLGKLQGQASLGENAAAQTGAFGTTTAGNIGQTIVGAANASAAGTIGSANAISGGINGLGNAFLTSQLFGANGMYGNANTYGNQLQNSGNYYTGNYSGDNVPI